MKLLPQSGLTKGHTTKSYHDGPVPPPMPRMQPPQSKSHHMDMLQHGKTVKRKHGSETISVLQQQQKNLKKKKGGKGLADHNINIAQAHNTALQFNPKVHKQRKGTVDWRNDTTWMKFFDSTADYSIFDSSITLKYQAKSKNTTKTAKGGKGKGKGHGKGRGNMVLQTDNDFGGTRDHQKTHKPHLDWYKHDAPRGKKTRG
jgi:hypothetical protein